MYFFQSVPMVIILLFLMGALVESSIDHAMTIGKYGPFAKPHNFPNRGVAPPAIAPPRQSPDGAPKTPLALPVLPANPPVTDAYEDGFPVINVRYQYPPSALDNMRRDYLAKRNGDILTNTRIINSNMNNYMELFTRHFVLLEKIVGYLLILPRNLKTKLQNYLLRLLADEGILEVPSGPLLAAPESAWSKYIKEKPLKTESALNRFNRQTYPERFQMNAGLPRASSFIQSGGSSGDRETTESSPQVNIGIEDNLNEFSDGSEIGLDEAEIFVREISQSWHLARHLLVELIKIKLKQIELISKFLFPKLFKTSRSIKTLRADQAREERKIKPVSFAQAAVGQTAKAPPTLFANDTVLTNAFFNQTNLVDPGRVGPIGSLDVATVAELRARVMQGGRSGAASLAGLIDLWDQQLGWRDLIRKSKVNVDCRLLLSMQKTPDYIKNLAGSLLTLMTGAPVSTSVSDPASGSYGHVNVIVPRPSRTYLPDKEIALSVGG